MEDTATRQDEMAAKLAQVRAWLDRRGHAAVLLGTQSGFAWITAGGQAHVSLGSEAAAAAVLVTPDSAHVLTSSIETHRISDEETDGLGLDAVEFPWYTPDGARAAVRALCDPAATVADVDAIGLGPLGLKRADVDLTRLRHTLQPAEIDRYRQLGRDAAEAVESACRAATAGETELAVAARLTAECTLRGIQPLTALVAADDRISRYRHPLPTHTPAREMLLVSLTGRRHGLHASLTRMVAFVPVGADTAARHQAVSAVDVRAILASRPGTALADVFREVAEAYAAVGFPGEWRRHHQGGLTGYAGREIFATRTSPEHVGASQAFAWNPSITSVKSEDTVVVTADGKPDILTRTGTWPEQPVRLDTGTLRRPAILHADR